MSRSLDQRRLHQVKPRDPTEEDFSLDSYAPRLLRVSLTKILGAEGYAEYVRNRTAWQKHWNSSPIGSTPGAGWGR